jgi:hypothetical protein
MKTKIFILAIAYTLGITAVQASTSSFETSDSFEADVTYSKFSSEIKLICRTEEKRPFFVQLLNESGEAVYAVSGSSVENDFTRDIDVSDMPEGKYLMQIISDGESSVKEVEITQ